MRVIHARILSSILPVWRHACLPACSPPVVAALVSILRVCAEGTSQQAVLALRAAGGAAAGAGAAGIGRGALGRPVFAPDPALVQSIVEMGFSAARAEEAIRRVGANSVEAAMEWLVMHPEEPPPPAPAAPAAAGGEAAGGAAAAGTAAAAAPAPAAPVQDDDTRLGATLAAALAGISETVADLTPPTAPPPIEATATSTTDAAGAAAPAAAPAAADAAAAAASAAAARGAVPGPEQVVEGALAILARSSASTGSISDLLYTLAARDAGRERGAVVAQLLGCLKSAAAAAAVDGGKQTLAAARLLLLLLTRDAASVEAASQAGMAELALGLVEEWMAGYGKAVAAATAASAATAAAVQPEGDAAAPAPVALPEELVAGLRVPVWVEAMLLVLEMMANTAPRRTPAAAAAGAAAPAGAAGGAAPAGTAAAAAAAPAAAATAVPPPAQPADSPVAGEPAAAAAAAPAGEAAGAGPSTAAAPAAEPAGARTPAAGAPAGAPAPAPAAAGGAAGLLPAALSEALTAWRPCGLLGEGEQARAMKLCTGLLQALQTHGDKWCPPLRLAAAPAADEMVPSPSSATQAVLQLLARLTRKHSNAALVGYGGCDAAVPLS